MTTNLISFPRLVQDEPTEADLAQIESEDPFADDLDIEDKPEYIPQTDGWNIYPEDIDNSDIYDKEYDVP